ncbi:MAG: ABC transporter permease [Thermoplasmatota archaeon]
MRAARLLSHSLWIAHKDLLEFSRNRVMLVMLFVFPLFMMMMTGYIFPSGNTVRDLPVSVVNLDSFNGTTGPESLAFYSTLDAVNKKTGYFAFSNASSEEDARAMITRGDRMGAVIIPANFTANLRGGSQGFITVLFDQSKPQISLQLTSILDSVIAQMGTSRAVQTVRDTTGENLTTSTAIVTPYKVENRGIVPGSPNYFEFMAPGMMMMVVMFSVMTGLPRAISHEKEAGTFDGVLAAPTSRFSIILGKTIAQSVRGMIQGSVVLLLALALFGVVVNGPIALVVFLLLLGIFSFIGLGIAIASAAKDEETAATFMMVLQFPMMFLSGVFFPIEQMPWYMQLVSRALPLTYATQAMRKVVVLGAGLGDIATEVAVLSVFGGVLLLLAIPLFKRAMAR